MKIVQVIGTNHDREYAEPFEEMGMEVLLSRGMGSLHKASLVCLIGGADVNPAYYGEEPNPLTHFTAHSSALDEQILGPGGVIDYCTSYGIPMVGICKGSQQLGVKAGGKLIQHLDNHPGNHEIKVAGKNKYVFTFGGHHQAVDTTTLPKDSYKYLAASINDAVADVIYYKELNALGMQSHPEWAPVHSEHREYFKSLVCDLLEGKL